MEQVRDFVIQAADSARSRSERLCAFGEQWLSLAGCGLLPARMLEQAGFDVRQGGGFGFGLGLERLAMLKFGTKDIRELWQPPYVP